MAQQKTARDQGKSTQSTTAIREHKICCKTGFWPWLTLNQQRSSPNDVKDQDVGTRGQLQAIVSAKAMADARQRINARGDLSQDLLKPAPGGFLPVLARPQEMPAGMAASQEQELQP